MNFLFFSHTYDNKEFVDVLIRKNKKLPGVAISNYENGFINAFYTNKENKITFFNRPFYPFVAEENFNENELSTFEQPIKLCSHKYQNSFSFREFKNNELLKDELLKTDIVVFSTYHDWRLFKHVKKINPSIKSILILPDLPNFIINKSSFKHRILRKFNSKMFFNACKYIDGLIPITDYMGEYMSKYIKSFITIEGVVKDDEKKMTRDKPNKTIVYTGGLAEKYGVMSLIRAFSKCDEAKDYELIICGKGELENQIKEFSKDNKRIQYKGFVDRKEVLSLITKASYLVVPENPNNSYSKYSFHSKIIEYMCSGTPIIATYYDGMPKEYKTHILNLNLENNSLDDAILSGLQAYLKLPIDKNIEFGLKARSFILERLMPEQVYKKINELIGEVNK